MAVSIASLDIPLEIREVLERLASGDRERHGEDYALLLDATARSVAWADAAWPVVKSLLGHSDNRVRSIAGQALCRLAPAVNKAVVIGDLETLVAATRDERFVTARHILASLWQVGAADGEVRQALLTKLQERADGATTEKNAALTRYDIVACLRRLFTETGDDDVKAVALTLAKAEPDQKNAKKMGALWAKPRTTSG